MNATDEHGGYSPGNPFRRRHEADDPLGATNETPVDPAAVQADDALLDALDDGEFDEWLHRANAEFNRKLATQVDVELALAKVLDAWRRDVDTEPVGAELVDTDTALAAIRAGRRTALRRHPVLGPVLAVLVMAFSVLGLLSLHAAPGEWLWPLHELLYSKDGLR